MASSYFRGAQLGADDLRWIFSNHPGWPCHVALKDYDNPPIIRSRFPMQYQPVPCSELEHLRKTYKLDEVVKDAQGDMDYFLKLSLWVRSHWSFGSPNEGEPPWDASYLITRGVMGEPFNCICAAVLFIQAMQALGRQARLLNVRKPGDTRLWKYEPLHALAEAYSDDFEKWVVVDANNCSMFTLKDSPVSLNALELHNLVMEGRSDEVRAHQRRWKTFEQEERLHLHAPEKLTEHLAFFTRFVVGTANDMHERAGKAGTPVRDYQDLDLYSRLAWYDAKTPLRETSQATSDPDDLYPSVNRVHMDLTFEQAPRGMVEVLLTHCVPNLDCFEVQVDGQEWRKVGCGFRERVFNWQLHPGNNRVKARGVNSSGLKSRESAIALEYGLGTNAGNAARGSVADQPSARTGSRPDGA
jgi:hypothetical protein